MPFLLIFILLYLILTHFNALTEMEQDTEINSIYFFSVMCSTSVG